MPYSYDFTLSKDDILRQIEYELEFRPTSCVTEIIQSWYNWLYSQLSEEGTFDCGVSTGDIVDVLLGLPVNEVEDILLDYYIQYFNSLPNEDAVEDAAEEFEELVEIAEEIVTD